MTLDGNFASSRGGGIDQSGVGGSLALKRVAVTNNDSGGFGGGIFTQSDTKITDSVIDSNSLAGQTQNLAQGGGFYTNNGSATEQTSVRFVRTSVTNNELTATETQQGAGIFARGADLYLENTTVSSNLAPLAGADGGGIFAAQDETLTPPAGSAEIHFSTFRDNVAGTGTTDGDALYAAFADNPISIHASIIDESTDGCKIGSGTDIQSAGYNVEDTVDADCGIDAPTDSHASDFLNPLIHNGDPPVGVPGIPPFDAVTFPLSHAFTNDSSAALDLVPESDCEVNGKRLKTDSRGVPRPEGDGCDAGTTERVACLGEFVIGPASHIGRKGRDQIQGSHAVDDIIFAQEGA